MSDPQPNKLRPRPRRANPVQPDSPLGGTEAPEKQTEDFSDEGKQDALKRGGYEPGTPTQGDRP